jgi:UDP-N-acetylglucosamine--N-acetylmuramyl-(pentapeptide) pyrophosphoryl-undecaprenol N-acetylglucosamine transferase
MKVLIAGGGTGGHLYPGIAIAREVLREQGNEVLFVGTSEGIEAKVLPREGLPLRFITVGKLKGMKLAAMLKTLIALPRALFQSLRIVKETRPDVVIGVGGYASGPVAIAAWMLRTPLVLVEPNSYPGLVNRKLGKMATAVALCFPGTAAERFFPARVVRKLGPLVRKGIISGERSSALTSFHLDADRFTVFVMGGSGGAHAINAAMQQAAKLLAQEPRLQVLHQTGEKDADAVSAAYREAGLKATVLPYIHDMPAAYAAADLVISRSGATTVAELAVCNKQAILVPFPFAADNHQEFNARTLAASGNADVVLQKDLKPETLFAMIRERASRAKVVSSGFDDRAAEEIARMCKTYVQTH